jgi:two-component system, cell cycle response regulator DivK
MASLPSAPSCGPLILIVDDSADTRFVYAWFLEYCGFDVVTAVDAKAAMASMVSRTPNVIVMDFSMPGMDGLSATRLLKRDPQTTHVPVIILTGHTHIVTAAAAREAGASVLAVKPCLPDTLEAEIRRLLAEGGGEFRYVRDTAASIAAQLPRR